jgi:ABC-type glutathione transport system ATPase component
VAQPVADPIIRCDRLSIAYVEGDATPPPVVDRVSFTLERGQSLGIVGESGSGKSTLARALLGYLRGGGRFVDGTLTVDGVVVTEASRAALASLRGLRVAMVPQNPLSALTFHMSVGRQVREVLRVRRGLSRADAERRTLTLFSEMGLSDPSAIAQRFPHQLSGGQRQRVVVAAALACDPSLLILDEPTTALDKTTEAQVLDLIQRLRTERGAALVLVTHDLNVVAEVCRSVMVMKDGRSMEQGAVTDVFRRPATDYTRALLSSALDLDGRPPSASDTAPSLLDVRQLTFTYERPGWLARPRSNSQRPALDRIDLAQARGEVLGVIGESGSGKTTLGHLVAGLAAPRSGDLVFEGRPIGRLAGQRDAETRRRIQLIFQDPLSSLNPRQTVATAVIRPLRHFFGLSRKVARIQAEKLLAELGLGSEYLTRYPRQLSGGQQQRVAIARAFAAEPDLLVCDEITSALDASVQAQVLVALDTLRRRNRTSVLLITHDLGVIWRMASRVIVLKDGRIIEHGPTAEVFGAPTDPYTRGLLEAATRASRLKADKAANAPPADKEHPDAA